MKYCFIVLFAALALSACITPYDEVDWESNVLINEEGTLYASGTGLRASDAMSMAKEMAQTACLAQNVGLQMIRSETEYTGKVDQDKRAEMMSDYDIADKDYKQAKEKWKKEKYLINRSFLTTDYAQRQVLLEKLNEPQEPVPPSGIGKDYQATIYFRCVSSK